MQKLDGMAYFDGWLSFLAHTQHTQHSARSFPPIMQRRRWRSTDECEWTGPIGNVRRARGGGLIGYCARSVAVRPRRHGSLSATPDARTDEHPPSSLPSPSGCKIHVMRQRVTHSGSRLAGAGANQRGSDRKGEEGGGKATAIAEPEGSCSPAPAHAMGMRCDACPIWYP